ncbi:MAG: hypothetical protein R3190_16980 [Thermoanaerobaculia bacterium]|nr:hypothetical protein [Thermoanaerobaculia bacterium]
MTDFPTRTAPKALRRWAEIFALGRTDPLRATLGRLSHAGVWLESPVALAAGTAVQVVIHDAAATWIADGVVVEGRDDAAKPAGEPATSPLRIRFDGPPLAIGSAS